MIYVVAAVMLIVGIYGVLYKNPFGAPLVVGAVIMSVLKMSGAIA